ncbi:MAG TPA: peptidoglycan DD-metalloendopeptidase family protein [Acidothermaceae bacterium]
MATPRWSWLAGLLTTTFMLGVGAPSRAAAGSGRGFAAPLAGPLEVTRRFAPPDRPWEPGNRGVDLATNAGAAVYAATAGVVLYAGELAGRGVISIRDGTLRTTYEPVDPVVHAGDVVTEGEVIGYVAEALDNCGSPGSCLHWGALRSNAYVDPMSLLRAPAIRLLPIWNGPVELSRLLG